ncbi:MAG: 30S ribosomal protein S8 [Planctomycetota bacterium]
MMTDPIADMLTRIRNANSMHRRVVSMPATRIKVGIAQALKDEGYIEGYQVVAGKRASRLDVSLRYGPEGELVIRGLERVSTPGRRVYSGVQDLPQVLRGLGTCILSTPNGILSDRAAREGQVGGEILCKVW